jgi:2-phosphoglycerate kinase
MPFSRISEGIKPTNKIQVPNPTNQILSRQFLSFAVMSKISFLCIKEDNVQYTKTNLITTLHLMGCKPKPAIDISEIIFSWIEKEPEKVKDLNNIQIDLKNEPLEILKVNHCGSLKQLSLEITKVLTELIQYNRSNIAVVPRKLFIDMVKISLCIHEHVHKENGQSKIEEFLIASQVHERKIPLIILFGGTSGCGKSTLAALLASRIGINQVLSTDSVRHMLRTFISEKENPVVFASTYHAYESLKDSKLTGKELVLEGYYQQSRAVTDYLDKFIEKTVHRKTSLIVEGVHLTSQYVLSCMERFPNILPFFIFISNEVKHRERFAVRAKYMTLDKQTNKYVQYFDCIRIIQGENQQNAMLHNIPTIDNTSVDRSIASIMDAIFHSLKHLYAGESLYDKETKKSTIKVRSTLPKYAWSSKSMLKLIIKKNKDDKEERKEVARKGVVVVEQPKPVEKVEEVDVKDDLSDTGNDSDVSLLEYS